MGVQNWDEPTLALFGLAEPRRPINILTARGLASCFVNYGKLAAGLLLGQGDAKL